jgi:RNA polymerase sigma factor (TIGR02999 family)
MAPKSQPISELLEQWRSGDRTALERLAPLVHHELLKIARSHLRRERRNHTLQSSALVNEAYLRLMPHDNGGWHDRKHFFAVAAQVMRRVLVDYARDRRRKKGPGAAVHVAIEDEFLICPDRLEEVLAIDDALNRLASVDPRKTQVVEMRFFGGLGVEETAAVLGIAPNTVIRDWSFARAWLRTHLTDDST